jgi:hypothetical protein
VFYPFLDGVSIKRKSKVVECRSLSIQIGQHEIGVEAPVVEAMVDQVVAVGRRGNDELREGRVTIAMIPVK